MCYVTLFDWENDIFLWCSVLCWLMIKSYYKVMRVLIQISVVILSPLKEFHRQRLWSFTVYQKLSKDQKRQYCLELIPRTQWLPFCSVLQHQTLQLIFSMAVKVNPCDNIIILTHILWGQAGRWHGWSKTRPQFRAFCKPLFFFLSTGQSLNERISSFAANAKQRMRRDGYLSLSYVYICYF